MKYSYTQLHFHKSAQFLKPTPRTFREAFGYSWQEENRSSFKLVAILAVVIVFLLLFCVKYHVFL